MTISQAIQRRLNLTSWNQEDKWWQVVCPFHNDSHPSAGINFKLKAFNCHVCGGMPFLVLAKKLDIDYSSIEEANEDFNDFLFTLTEGQAKERPLVLRKQVEIYTNFLLERKIKPETVEEFGGYYVSDESHQDYGHLVIPYQTNKGIKYVKRRILGQGQRFIQSPNNTKDGDGDSKALLGKGFNAHDTIILVEGVTDLFAIWPHFKNTVASFGSKLTAEQAYLIRNKIIFILYDRDYAGYNGSIEAAKILREFGCTVIILEIPEEFKDADVDKIDPNSAYCNNPDSFIEWIAGSISKYSIFDRDYVQHSFINCDQNKTFLQLQTQITTFDNNLNGGLPTGLHAIAGKEGIGKSSFLIFLAIKAALQGMKVLLVSYELTKEQMWARIISFFSKYSWSEIEADRTIIEPELYDLILKLSELIRVERDWSIDEIKAAHLHFMLIGIDYIQRMPYEGNDERAGIKKNTYSLGDIAYKGEGKIVVMLSSMPEQGTTIFKETNVIKYAVQTGWILERITGNVLKLNNIKNTRGKKDWSVYLDIDYAHQKAIETVKPELQNFLPES